MLSSRRTCLPARVNRPCAQSCSHHDGYTATQVHTHTPTHHGLQRRTKNNKYKMQLIAAAECCHAETGDCKLPTRYLGSICLHTCLPCQIIAGGSFLVLARSCRLMSAIACFLPCTPNSLRQSPLPRILVAPPSSRIFPCNMCSQFDCITVSLRCCGVWFVSRLS